MTAPEASLLAVGLGLFVVVYTVPVWVRVLRDARAERSKAESERKETEWCER